MSINRMMLLSVLEQSTCCWTLIELCKKVEDRQGFHLQVKSPRNATKRLETWRVLERFYRSGRARAIGVSNYEQRHLQELLDCASIKPMVNQVSAWLWEACVHPDATPGLRCIV